MATVGEVRPFDLTDAAAAVQDLAVERGSQDAHRLSLLSRSLAVEAVELLDATPWLSCDDADEKFTPGAVHPEVIDELADVTINLISLVAASELDLGSAVLEKMNALRRRSPPSAAGGTAADVGECQDCGLLLRTSWTYCPRCGWSSGES